MTALASSLLAALPGGFTPFAGTGAAASAGGVDVFEGLLAGLMAGEADARPRMPGLPDEAGADAGRAATDAIVQPDNALAAFGAMPAPPAPPLSAALPPSTAESAATVTPDALRPARPSPVAAFRAGQGASVPPSADGGGDPADLTAVEAVVSPVDPSTSVAVPAAQGWNRPRVAATAAATPAQASTPAPAVTDQARVETAVPTTETTPAVPGEATPVRAGLVRQADRQSSGRTADNPPGSVRAASARPAEPAIPAIPAQPASGAPAQPAVPPVRTEAAAMPLAAPVKAVAPEGEGRRPAIAARGDRPAQSAARHGLAPAAASDHPAPVETAAATLAAIDGDETAATAPDAAPIELAEAPEARPLALPAEARAAAVSTAGVVTPETLVRGSPETVAKLAADIVRKLDGQTTRFDLELDPHGLGKVDVAIEIDRAGKMTAALTFDSPQSAADLRGRSGELRLALEQAGFDLSEGGLTFDLAGQGPGFGGREAAQQERGWNGRAFQRAQSGAEEADTALAAATQTPTRTRSGIDIRI